MKKKNAPRRQSTASTGLTDDSSKATDDAAVTSYVLHEEQKKAPSKAVAAVAAVAAAAVVNVSSPQKQKLVSTAQPVTNWPDYYRDDEDDYPVEYFLSASQKNLLDKEPLTELDKMIIQRLACRKFHIPGNSFWSDYIFWFCNNHPMVCFWLADRRHPLGTTERVLNLVASLAFGLAATCSVVLWFFYHEEYDFDHTVFTLFHHRVSVGMLTLLAFSGPLHVIFDLSLFFVQACPPCRTGGVFAHFLPESHLQCWLWIGAQFAFLVTIASLSLAINAMLIRAAMNSGNNDVVTLLPQNYSFLGMYVVEVVVANFIVFPIGTFTMFSGVLGCCGRIPGLGGRPYQVRKHQLYLERQKAKANVRVGNDQRLYEV